MAFLENFSFLSKLAAFEQSDKVLWLLKVRWIAIFFQCVCLAIGIHWQMVASENLPWLIAIVAGEVMFNALSHFLAGSLKGCSFSLTAFHLIADVLFLTALLSLTGACKNPFYGIFYFHAVLGAILLRDWRASSTFVAVLCLCIAWTCHMTPHEWVMMAGIPHNIRIAAEVSIALLIWTFCYWLSSLGEASQRKVMALNEYKSRIDHLRLLGVASANLSHEIASPLNAVRIQLERLARQYPPLSASEEFLQIQAATEACRNQLHQFHHFRNEGASTAVEMTNVGDFIKNVCENWRGNNLSRSINFSLSGDEICDKPNLPIPRLAFARAILDVLDNSLDASPEDVEIDVKIDEADNGSVIVSFIDRGHGFAQQILKNLGKPFNSLKPNGSGLGLYNCMLFAASIGGEFKASNIQRGAKVEFLIPKLA